MAPSPVRVVAATALKTLMAYGGTVLDLREETAGLERLPERLADCTTDPDRLILLLVEDVTATLAAVAGLAAATNGCVVVVNAGPALSATAPVETPG